MAGQESCFLSKELSTIIVDIPEIGELPLEALQLNIRHDVLRASMEQYELNIRIDASLGA
ncbi:hypothetical protein D3C81_2191790 [compost metagenome]